MAFGSFSLSNSNTSLFISGPQAGELTLRVAGPIPNSGTMTLFTQGPAASPMPLWIGREIDSSGAMPLYLEVPWATGAAGTTLVQGDTTLYVLGDLYYATNSGAPLAISAPSIGSGVGTIALAVATDAIPSGYAPGVIPDSGFMTIVLSGSGVTGATNQTSLFIRVEETASSGLPLFMERNIPETLSLQIRVKYGCYIYI